MVLLLKILFGFMMGCGMLVLACNIKAADDGDKKAKKLRNVGIGMFIVGAVALSLCIFFSY